MTTTKSTAGTISDTHNSSNDNVDSETSTITEPDFISQKLKLEAIEDAKKQYTTGVITETFIIEAELQYLTSTPESEFAVVECSNGTETTVFPIAISSKKRASIYKNFKTTEISDTHRQTYSVENPKEESGVSEHENPCTVYVTGVSITVDGTKLTAVQDIFHSLSEAHRVNADIKQERTRFLVTETDVDVGAYTFTNHITLEQSPNDDSDEIRLREKRNRIQHYLTQYEALETISRLTFGVFIGLISSVILAVIGARISNELLVDIGLLGTFGGIGIIITVLLTGISWLFIAPTEKTNQSVIDIEKDSVAANIVEQTTLDTENGNAIETIDYESTICTVTETQNALLVTGVIHNEEKTWRFEKRPSGVLDTAGKTFLEQHPTENTETSITVKQATRTSQDEWVSDDGTWEIIP